MFANLLTATWTVVVAVCVGLGAIAAGVAAFHRYVVRPLMHVPAAIRAEVRELVEAVLLADGTDGMLKELVEEIVSHELATVLDELRKIRRKLADLEREVRRAPGR